MDPLELLLRLNGLARLPRTGWLLAGVPSPESIADHSLGTALVALTLGPRVAPPLSVERAVALAVVHDAPEALVTDLPHTAAQLLPAGAKATAESRAAERLFRAEAPHALALWREAQEGSTREARFVRICDKLHLGLTLLGYQRAGHRALGEFLPGLRELETEGFEPCEELRKALLAALDEPPGL